jgi:hypothetical protein
LLSGGARRTAPARKRRRLGLDRSGERMMSSSANMSSASSTVIAVYARRFLLSKKKMKTAVGVGRRRTQPAG